MALELIRTNFWIFYEIHNKALRKVEKKWKNEMLFGLTLNLMIPDLTQSWNSFHVDSLTWRQQQNNEYFHFCLTFCLDFFSAQQQPSQCTTYFDLLNSQLRNRTEGSFSGPIFLSDYKYFDKLNPWMSWFHKIENWISKWINTISVWSVFNGILVSTWHHSWCWLAHAQRLSNSSLNIFDNQDVNNEKVNFTKIRRLKRLKTNWILGEISSKLKPSIWRENVL